MKRSVSVGDEFSRWTVLKPAERRNFWTCKCQCGTVRDVRQYSLYAGLSTGCGCTRQDGVRKAVMKHGCNRGHSPTREYVAWIAMNDRCANRNNVAFHNYGGRGIAVCERWRGECGFANFLADMGPKPSPQHSLDRYPNTDGNYEPGNVRWATRSEQNRNKRNSVLVNYRGQVVCVSDLAKATGRDRHVLSRRIRAGMSAEEALSF